MMDIIKDKNLCNGCAACMSICTKNCITMSPDEEGFLYPIIDQEQCVHCGLCERSCPILSSAKLEETPGEINVYSAISNDKEMLTNSSSGGLFGTIARHVINLGGVVFGAAFNEDFSVGHKYIESIEELGQLQGSKYVQSNIGETYRQAKKFLEENRLVYFSGTPCQVEGFLAFLKKPYDNLIAQDLICHGVPSPMVWEKYINYQKNKFGQDIVKVSFRDKTSGWKTFSMKIQFENGNEYCQTLQKDLYLKAFLKNLCLRPSCYNCSFKSINRRADITLADFWGVENVDSKIPTKDGVSLILVHTDKGKKLLQEIESKVLLQSVDLQKSIAGNSSIRQSVTEPKDRASFMKKLVENDFSTVKKYCEESVLKKICRLIQRIRNRLFRRNKK